MTDTPDDTPTLLRLFEEQVADALELPAKERALAFQRLREGHPQHAKMLGRCEQAAASTEPEDRSVEVLSHAVRRLALAEAPERIGDYRILDVLGEGGMGIVYLAEQERPVRRRVALKVIKTIGAERDVLARFEVERQSLALMSHPNIAQVLDAGETADGRPFFAMERVPGIPITDFCDRQQLDLTARIELFRKVCHGVQHAHEKGVIHRDLKPSNILVVSRDGVNEPKIIDFGVAKALQQPLTDRPLYTEQGRILGTPEYMSPEQAELGAVAPDARSDVYSLGVLLYELLVGALPFDPRMLREAGYLEIRRRIREDEPNKPSTRLTTETGATKEILRRRKTDRSTLVRALRGDLDWITMRCLEKEPARRYTTANGLADDLARHLESRPVLAGPPSLAYRLRKAVRRHRRIVFAAAAVLVALAVGSNLPGFFGRSAAESTTSVAGSTVSAICPLFDDHGGFSPDGRYFTHTDWADGRLMVHDTTTGESESLTNDATWDEGGSKPRFATFSGFGPDNRTICFSWFQDGVPELRLLDVQARRPRTVLRDAAVEELGFYDFTPKSDHVLFVAERSKGESTLELVRLADGNRQVLTRLRAVRSSVANVSPDGRWVVFEDMADATTSRRQLQIVPVDGGPARPLAASAGFDARPFWTPDGQRVVFQSDRGGPMATWAVEVVDGEATGPAARIVDLGRIHPLGFLADGSLVFHRFSPGMDVFVADYTPQRSPATSAPTRINQSFLGTNYAPCWSPDGRTIAYLSRRGALETGVPGIVLVLHDVEKGSERTLATPGFRMLRAHQIPWQRSSEPHFAPDGSRIVLSGFDPAGTIVVRSVDLATGRTEPLPIPASVQPRRVLPLSGDSYLYRSQRTEGLFEWSGETSTSRKISDRSGPFVVTSDEREILVCDGDEVVAVSRTDGTERALYVPPPNTLLLEPLLCPTDGEDWLLLREVRAGRGDPGRHSRIRLRDARFEPFELGPIRRSGITAVSPDGHRWAYQSPTPRKREMQVWRWRGALFD